MIRKRRDFMAWTGLVLLAFNLIAGALMPAQAQSPLGQSGQQIYICTALGLKAIGPDADQTDPAQSANHGVKLCAFCLPLMQGGVDGPAAMAAVDAGLTISLAEYAPAAQSFVLPLARQSAASPRAPPVS